MLCGAGKRVQVLRNTSRLGVAFLAGGTAGAVAFSLAVRPDAIVERVRAASECSGAWMTYQLQGRAGAGPPRRASAFAPLPALPTDVERDAYLEGRVVLPVLDAAAMECYRRELRPDRPLCGLLKVSVAYSTSGDGLRIDHTETPPLGKPLEGEALQSLDCDADGIDFALPAAGDGVRRCVVEVLNGTNVPVAWPRSGSASLYLALTPSLLGEYDRSAHP